MRLRKIQSNGDCLFGLSHLSMYFDRVSSGENSELARVCDFLRDKYLHCVEMPFYDNPPGQLSRLETRFADFDFKEKEDFWKSGASYDRDACQNFGNHLRTHFPRRASLVFANSSIFPRSCGSNAPKEYPDVPPFEAGVLYVSFTRSPETIQQFGFITAYETPRHQEIFREILHGQRATYDKSALDEYRKSKQSLL